MSSTTNGEEPPLKKKKKKPSTEPNSISSFPDDLIVSCLARVSRLHYPLLSLVSKSFRSLLASPEIYRTRNLLNRTESCLYVCLQLPSEINPRWFTLCKKPTQALSKKGKEKEVSSGYALAPVRTLNSPTVEMEWSNLIAVGYNLYAIKATEEEESPPFCNIPYLDCRTHTWLEAPNMRIAHADCRFNGDLYLPGSRENLDSSLLNCVEVFNTKTQTWNHPVVPPDNRLFELGNMEGKIYCMKPGKKGWVYKPKESTFARLDKISDLVSYCFIEKLVYDYSSKEGFEWSDFELGVCGKLKGLEGLPKFASYSKVKLTDYGGNLVVLWDKYVPKRGGYKEKMIWCAEISLEKRNNGEDKWGQEIWGKVEWVDALLTVLKSYKFVYAIAATV